MVFSNQYVSFEGRECPKDKKRTALLLGSLRVGERISGGGRRLISDRKTFALSRLEKTFHKAFWNDIL